MLPSEESLILNKEPLSSWSVPTIWMRSASGQVLLHWLPISRVVPGAGPSHRVARVVFSEELSNTPVAHKLQYLKGGICGVAP